MQSHSFNNKIISIEELWGFYNLTGNLFSIIGTDGYLKHLNAAITLLLGYTEEELLSVSYFKLVHPDDRSYTKLKIEELSAGKTVSFKNRIHTAGEEYKWIYWTAACPYKDKNIYIIGHDYTEKQAMEEEMEKLSLVARKIPNGITVTGPDKKISWVNTAFTQMTGYEAGEVIGKEPGEILFGPLTSKETNELMRLQIEKGLPFAREVINYKKNGDPFWMKVEGQPLYDENGKIKKWVALQTDITNQKMAEQALISNEKNYRTIFNDSPLPKIIFDPGTLQILEVNEQAMGTYGYSSCEFIHLYLTDLIVGKDAEQLSSHLKTFDDGKIYHANCNHLNKNGELLNMEITATFIEYKNNRAMLLIAKDITEKARLERQLMEERLNKERSVLEATLYGQEMERIEIGRELHDNINQMLSSVKLYQELAINNEEMRLDILHKSKRIVEDAIQEIRALSSKLVASKVKEIGLMESVNDLIDTIKCQKGLSFTFQVNGFSEKLPNNGKLMLFRIIQEQLNNILKYAFAKKVAISLSVLKGFITLQITDDGRGFDPLKKRNGIGLSNILSRTRLYKGTMDISSAENNGCRLTVKIPADEILKQERV